MTYNEAIDKAAQLAAVKKQDYYVVHDGAMATETDMNRCFDAVTEESLDTFYHGCKVYGYADQCGEVISTPTSFSYA